MSALVVRLQGILRFAQDDKTEKCGLGVAGYELRELGEIDVSS